MILTFAVYKRDLSSNATPVERTQASAGYVAEPNCVVSNGLSCTNLFSLYILSSSRYLGGIFDIESLVEKLLHQLASKQTILVNVYDTTNSSRHISMFGSNASSDGMLHVSALNFVDPFRKHEMHCR